MRKLIRNKIKIDKFLDKLMPYINNTMNVYYEETPKNAVYPYGVIPDLSNSTLDYGLQCFLTSEASSARRALRSRLRHQ